MERFDFFHRKTLAAGSSTWYDGLVCDSPSFESVVYRNSVVQDLTEGNSSLSKSHLSLSSTFR